MQTGTLVNAGVDFAGPEREPWMADALCAETAPEAFFPEKGGSTRSAKQICASCDVVEQCLTYALQHDERFGIWGGKSERERRSMRKGQPAAVSPLAVRDEAIRKMHAQGLLDTEIAPLLDVSPEVVGRRRRALHLKTNGRGGMRASMVDGAAR